MHIKSKELAASGQSEDAQSMPNMAAKTLPTPMTALVEMSKLRASLFLVAVDEPEAVDVLPDAPGLLWSPAHVNLPLMTLLEPDSALKVLQSEVISFELCRLKAPLQSARDGSVTLHYGQT